MVVAGIFVFRGSVNEPVQEVTNTRTEVEGVSTSPAPDASFPWEQQDAESLVPFDEIVSGGPPPDGIPPIDDPKFVSANEADAFLEDREPVVSLVHSGVARAYPLQILTWHEIVNDVVADDPITVTYCPLCNSAIAFDRRVPATAKAEQMLGVSEPVLDFGTSGRLYKSNLVMYDRQTKSLWIQFTGQSVAGPFIRTKLEKVAVQIVSWRDMKVAHPDVTVLSRDTGHSRSYGRNPYVSYDAEGGTPFLFSGEVDDTLPAMARVVSVTSDGDALAFPYATLERRAGDGDVAVATETFAGQPLVVFYEKGTASALDAGAISQGRDVGATGVFLPRAGDRSLTFEVRGDRIVDVETGSTWNLLGEAVAGPLQGNMLPDVVHDDTFWFVWGAFEPDTRVWRP